MHSQCLSRRSHIVGGLASCWSNVYRAVDHGPDIRPLERRLHIPPHPSCHPGGQSEGPGFDKALKFSLFIYTFIEAFLLARMVKKLPAMWEMWVWSLGCQSSPNNCLTCHLWPFAGRSSNTESRDRSPRRKKSREQVVLLRVWVPDHLPSLQTNLDYFSMSSIPLNHLHIAILTMSWPKLVIFLIVLRIMLKMKVAYKSLDILLPYCHTPSHLNPSPPTLHITEARGALQLECAVSEVEGPVMSTLLFLFLLSPLRNFLLCSSASFPYTPPLPSSFCPSFVLPQHLMWLFSTGPYPLPTSWST